MSRRVSLALAGDATRAAAVAIPADYPFSAPAVVAPALAVDKDVRVSRADLTALCDRVMGATADLQGAAALRRAARVIRGWLSARPALEGSDWQRYLSRLAKGLSSLAKGGAAAYRVFNESGNEKLPFVTFSALPVYTCPGAGECAQWCYSLKAWRYPAAFARQLQNTLLLRFAPHVIRAAFLALPEAITFRLYVDGDFGSLEDVALWMGLLSERPDVSAYGYSKSWDLLLAYDRQAGGAWPTNYALNLSSGGRAVATAGQMEALPITRGHFVALPISDLYKPNKRGPVGFERYDDDAYYAAVRQAAERAGYGKRVFLCPGRCGECTSKGHACALPSLRGVVIVNGAH